MGVLSCGVAATAAGNRFRGDFATLILVIFPL
jgi:hypothetical protein